MCVCYICDATLSEVQFNSEHNDIEPCGTCLTVVADTLAGFTDKASAEEDELGNDGVFDYYAALSVLYETDDEFA